MTPEDISTGDAGYRLMPLLRIAQRLGAETGATVGALLERAGYRASRPGFGSGEVRAMLISHPSLVDQWLAYSEAKETPEGWYVLRDAEIGQLLRPASQRRFACIEEAVAQFILRELDHHAGIAAPAGPPPGPLP